MNDLKNWAPPEGDANPMRMIDGEWFNVTYAIEKTCLERGKHRWGKDEYADEECTQGYHRCLDCYRCEVL